MIPAVAAVVSLLVVLLILQTVTVMRLRAKNKADKGQDRSHRERAEVPPVRTDRRAEAVPSLSGSVASGMGTFPSEPPKQAAGNSVAASLPQMSDAQPAGSSGVSAPVSQGTTPKTENTITPDSKQAVPSGAAGGNQDGHKATMDGNVLGMFMPLGEEDVTVSAIAGLLDDVEIRGLVEFAEKVSGELRT